MELTKHFQPIIDWAVQKGIIEKGDPKTQMTKLVEEFGELARAVLMTDQPKKKKLLVKDAVGDMVVVLTSIAYMHGLRIEECINHAYNEIKNRKGKMSGGDFKKDKS